MGSRWSSSTSTRTRRADITFTAHAPTGDNGVLYDQKQVISLDGSGGANGDPDEKFTFNVVTDFDTTKFTSKHPVHGWHIKLNITVYDAEGKEVHGARSTRSSGPRAARRHCAPRA